VESSSVRFMANSVAQQHSYPGGCKWGGRMADGKKTSERTGLGANHPQAVSWEILLKKDLARLSGRRIRPYFCRSRTFWRASNPTVAKCVLGCPGGEGR
jgi:hypothetical protein